MKGGNVARTPNEATRRSAEMFCDSRLAFSEGLAAATLANEAERPAT